MTRGPVDGTRAYLPDAATARRGFRRALHALYEGWGYRPVEVPALERYDPDHPRADQSFKLSDTGGDVLALRSDVTPAVARLVRGAWPRLADPAAAPRPVRLQVDATVWQASRPEIERIREFTQVGVELLGVRHPRADAELIHLARESVRTVGLEPRVEIGSPGFVKASMDAAGVPAVARDAVADALDRKDPRGVDAALRAAGATGPAADALRAIPDLYGGVELVETAREVAVGDAAHAALDHLAGVLAEFEDDRELLLDLGMARRLSYYTGVTFRAYTVDYGQPLLGGGRYDGAWLPYAAGFSLGLERLRAALDARDAAHPAADVVALDDAGARALRRAGLRVARAIAADVAGARAEARRQEAPWVLVEGRIEPTDPDAEPSPEAHAERARLEAALEASDG